MERSTAVARVAALLAENPSYTHVWFASTNPEFGPIKVWVDLVRVVDGVVVDGRENDLPLPGVEHVGVWLKDAADWPEVCHALGTGPDDWTDFVVDATGTRSPLARAHHAQYV